MNLVHHIGSLHGLSERRYIKVMESGLELLTPVVAKFLTKWDIPRVISSQMGNELQFLK